MFCVSGEHQLFQGMRNVLDQWLWVVGLMVSDAASSLSLAPALVMKMPRIATSADLDTGNTIGTHILSNRY
jgi:hypothetical protein